MTLLRAPLSFSDVIDPLSAGQVDFATVRTAETFGKGARHTPDSVHSLFQLGIDQTMGREFQSRMGRRSARARYIFSPALRTSDEIYMLTPGIGNHAVLTLRSTSDEPASEFAGMNAVG
jgi:hypothetical protein